MQIDELPAGEQTRHPDLDMNQVVGTHDILMLCFDTLRYDVSKEEEAAGRTPVLNSHGGEWEKRHAPGNFTYPSHFAIFAGFLPSPAEPHSLRSRNCFSPCKRVQDVFRPKEVIHLQKRLLCRVLPIQAMKRFV